jgi:hypothetical protein
MTTYPDVWVWTMCGAEKDLSDSLDKQQAELPWWNGPVVHFPNKEEAEQYNQSVLWEMANFSVKELEFKNRGWLLEYTNPDNTLSPRWKGNSTVCLQIINKAMNTSSFITVVRNLRVRSAKEALRE